MLICGQDETAGSSSGSSDLWMITTEAKAVPVERGHGNLSGGQATVPHSSSGWDKGSGRTKIKEDTGLLGRVADRAAKHGEYS